MSRADLVARLIAYEAAARQIKAALKAEGALEHEQNGSTPTWRLAFATASGSETHDRIDVTDLEKLMDYLGKRYPTEVATRTVRVVRNQEWLTQLRERLAILHRADLDEIAGQERAEDAPPPLIRDDEGAEVPGVTFVAGGDFLTVSVTPAMSARHHALAAARRGVLTGDWSALDALLADPRRLARAVNKESLDPDDKPG